MQVGNTMVYVSNDVYVPAEYELKQRYRAAIVTGVVDDRHVNLVVFMDTALDTMHPETMHKNNVLVGVEADLNKMFTSGDSSCVGQCFAVV
jgi:hypothetical protein